MQVKEQICLNGRMEGKRRACVRFGDLHIKGYYAGRVRCG